MKYRALVPVKSLHIAKSRLKDDLSPAQRSALVLKMLGHVLVILQMSKIFQSISVVSVDPEVIALSRRFGAHIYLEEKHGHNQALEYAAKQLVKKGHDPLLTISADLPLLQTTDIITMTSLLKTNEIVLAPSLNGLGTNAVFLSFPLKIPYLFGENSFNNYLHAAKNNGFPVGIYNKTSTALDIDTSQDLQALRQIRPDFYRY